MVLYYLHTGDQAVKIFKYRHIGIGMHGLLLVHDQPMNSS